jgi:hypothetical protein
MSSCESVQLVNVPGVGGANGIGISTTTTANFVIPAINGSVTISVASVAQFVNGQYIIIGGVTGNPANFVITAINAAGLTLTLTFLNDIGDLTTGSTMPSGSIVLPTGRAGVNNFTNTTATFLNLVNPTPFVVTVVSSAMLAINENVFISDGTNAGNFKVTAIPTSTSVQLVWLNYSGDSAVNTTFGIGALIIPAVINPIPVAAGGTGSTTAAGARTALGAAASGSNADITALTNLTTPIPLNEGGTGSSYANLAALLAALTSTPVSIAQGGSGQNNAVAALAALIQVAKTGTFIANGATQVTVVNANVTANSVMIATLKTVGGTVGAVPAVKTITPGTGFNIAATASDTSTYNYVILN